MGGADGMTARQPWFAVASPISQNVELVLDSVMAGNQIVLIDRVNPNVELAQAIQDEAERRGITVKVELIEDGISAELSE